MHTTTSQAPRTLTLDEAQRLYDEVHPMSNGILATVLTRIAMAMGDDSRPFAKMAVLEAVSRLEGEVA